MPIYEYRCPQGHLFELFQRLGEGAPAGCDLCGEGPVEKVLHAVPVHFKGSGFYSTDYGRSSKRNQGSRDGDGGGEGGGSSEKSGDAKPAETKTEKAGAD